MNAQTHAAAAPAPTAAIEALRLALAQGQAAIDHLARDLETLRSATTARPAALGDPRLLLTIPQAATLLGVSDSTAWRMVYAGELLSIKVGGARRIPREWLGRWVEEQVGVAEDEARQAERVRSVSGGRGRR